MKYDGMSPGTIAFAYAQSANGPRLLLYGVPVNPSRRGIAAASLRQAFDCLPAGAPMRCVSSKTTRSN